MSRHYVLDENRVCVPADLMTWARWFESNDHLRIVAQTKAGEADVSTVFIGLDHAFRDGPREVFETMVFGGPHDGHQVRYATWDQAEVGHAETVRMVGG